MPLQKCKENNKSGWKWGQSGKCYTGPGGRSKAIQQMKAIMVSEQASFQDLLLISLEEQLSQQSEINETSETN